MTSSFEADEDFWDDVLERVDRFSQAWANQTDPAEISAYLPEAGADSRAVTLVELVKVDLENRYDRGDSSMSIASTPSVFPSFHNRTAFRSTYCTKSFISDSGTATR